MSYPNLAGPNPNENWTAYQRRVRREHEEREYEERTAARDSGKCRDCGKTADSLTYDGRCLRCWNDLHGDYEAGFADD